MGVLFVADLSEDVEGNLFFNPTNSVSRSYNVYEVWVGQYPQNTYWTNWGGWYDNPISNHIELYIGGHNLISVGSLQDCCLQEWSIYDEPTAGMVYINVPKHPWLYDDIKTNYRKTISFLSGPKNPINPSDDVFDNERWPVKLEVPKFTVKLSDVINGLTKYSTFDFTLFNDDGFFDDMESTNFLNSPSYIKKTWKENPQVNDFITIRYGLVENIKINENTMSVSCADLFRTLEEPVSKVVKDIFTDAVNNVDDNLPVIYGTVTIPLIEIDTLKYVAGENITNISTVYDKDGNSIPFSYSSNRIITTTQEAKSAIVTGNVNNKIGAVITDIIADKTNIKYIDSFWDRTETNIYINSSPQINIAFTGGTVRDAIKNALVSDMVFLIQKNDGRFTIRQWDKMYNLFTIKNWEITKFPTKDYSEAQKNYLSSCSIKYDYDFSEKEYNNVLLYNEDEDRAEQIYSKLLRKEFNTYLVNNSDVYKLGGKLSDRFSTLRETIQIGLGHDTSEINLLDTIKLNVIINGRKFSKYNTWIVKEIDPAQDVLTLEPSKNQLPFEPDIPEIPDTPEPPEPPGPPGNNWWDGLWINYSYNGDWKMRQIEYDPVENKIYFSENLGDLSAPMEEFFFEGRIISDDNNVIILNVRLWKGYASSFTPIITDREYEIYYFPFLLISDGESIDGDANPFGDINLFYYP
jgi:hypothetical protein